MQQSTYTQNWNCIQALVDLRKSLIKWKKTCSASADESCNKSISLCAFDKLGPKLRALPPNLPIIPALFSMLILLETVPIILNLC